MENKRIDVTRREFQESCKSHYRLYQSTKGNKKTRRLILFYSVECGLKSLLMKETGNNTYEELIKYCELNQKKQISGHDIKAMLREINPRNDFTLKNIQLERGGSVQPKDFNQLWRYGAAVAKEEEEEKAEQTLRKIADWIFNRL